MFEKLPETALAFMDWPWSRIEPYYDNLSERPLDEHNVAAWLADWTRLHDLLAERYSRLSVAISVDTSDEEAEAAHNAFLDEIFPRMQSRQQALKRKLLESGLHPGGFEQPLRKMQAEADLFREENLPRLQEEIKLSIRYDKISGAQTVEWDGEERTVTQMRPILQDQNRETRERAWRLAAERQLADRQTLNELWQQLLGLRLEIAAAADKPDYRAYAWQDRQRFAYTPEDCFTFRNAIAEVVTPAAEQLYEKRRQQLGVDRLRPWDLLVDPLKRPPLKPFDSVETLKQKATAIFHQVDPELGGYFERMCREDLLDLDNRKNKAPGGYCTDFDSAKVPFIFMNAVGMHDDVLTLLHEGGHAFHVFETAHLPYFQLLQVPMEFAEVASMSMELLAAPYLTAEQGGFYTQAGAARAQIENLETSIQFWPYMAVVDGFQQWVYTHPQAASDPAECDVQWAELWERFMRGVDWSGLEAEMVTGWQRKLHIFQLPFYYVEYGLAQLGAMQVWRNALSDQREAVAAYRRALSLGGSVPLPELFSAAGARFAFDAEILAETVGLAMETIEKLEAVVQTS